MKLPYTIKNVLDSEKQHRFTVISTFAGGGGSSTGYRLAGGKILAVNEFVEEARNTYSANYPSTPILPGDIKELTGQDFLDLVGLQKGELDLLDGSPPCSAFSVAGSMCRSEGATHSDGWGKTKNYSDGKKVENIEDLFFEFIRVANDIQPKVIVAENVKGLTIGEAKSYYHRITNEFEKIGYYVSSKVMDASYHGVGQSRQRVIFIAVREDIAEKAGLTFMNISGIFPNTSSHRTTFGEVIEGVENTDEEIQLVTDKWRNSNLYKTTGSKMPSDPDKVLSGMNYHPKGHAFNMKRASMRKPSPTLTAMGCANITFGGIIHPLDNRKLTLPELIRLQSLPDDFKLTGEWKQKAERIGRMVPPLMMKDIADSIHEHVFSKL
jgi:DNA (cytosine-5)-methyltransferase 1